MLKDKLTIVVPHYNNLPGLNRLLLTIPTDKVNVIVVDDNSNIEQSAIKLKSDFPWVRFLVNYSLKSNAGSARNVGILNVTTSYVMFADSDDYYCEGAFDFISTIFTSHFDCAFFLTDTKIEFKDNKDDRNKFYNELVKNYYCENDESIRYKFHVPWSKVINMNMVKNYHLKFDETPVSNDIYFSISVGVNAKKIIAFNESVYCVVKNGTGISTDLSKEKSKVRLDVYTRCNELLMKNNIDYKNFVSTKGVFIRSRLNIFKGGDRIIIFNYITYGINILKYRINKYL